MNWVLIQNFEKESVWKNIVRSGNQFTKIWQLYNVKPYWLLASWPSQPKLCLLEDHYNTAKSKSYSLCLNTHSSYKPQICSSYWHSMQIFCDHFVCTQVYPCRWGRKQNSLNSKALFLNDTSNCDPSVDFMRLLSTHCPQDPCSNCQCCLQNRDCKELCQLKLEGAAWRTKVLR